MFDADALAFFEEGPFLEGEAGGDEAAEVGDFGFGDGGGAAGNADDGFDATEAEDGDADGIDVEFGEDVAGEEGDVEDFDAV